MTATCGVTYMCLFAELYLGFSDPFLRYREFLGGDLYGECPGSVA